MALAGIDLSKIKKLDYVILPSKMSGKEVFDKYKPDYLINATLFDVKSGEVITYSKDGDNRKGYLFSKNGIGFNVNTPIWTDYDKAIKDETITDFMGGSPTLVVNGEKNIDAGTTDSWILKSASYRSYIGFNSSKLYIGCTEQTSTIDNLANTCLNLGLTHAINLDGGGSCTMIQKGANDEMKYLMNRESRKCASWILIYLKTPVTTKETVTTVDIIGNDTEILNGIVINGRSYAPVREFEKLGCTVNYINGTVRINTPK